VSQESQLARRLIGIAILLVLLVLLLLIYRAFTPDQSPSPLPASPLAAAQVDLASPLMLAATVAAPIVPTTEAAAIVVASYGQYPAAVDCG
jgi:hypothetical protein